MSAPLEPTTLSIEGMTCSSCVNTVEKALNSVSGVRATVNFATETAHILAPAEMQAKDFIKIVEKAGYSISHVSVQIIGNRPKIGARRVEAIAALSTALGGADVALLATTTDGLGLTGEGKGIAAIASALITKN